MTLTNLETPIRTILDAAGTHGTIVETPGRATFAVLPLDDDLLDFLLERSPKLIAECARIRKEMGEGKSYSHEEVLRLLEVEETQ